MRAVRGRDLIVTDAGFRYGRSWLDTMSEEQQASCRCTFAVLSAGAEVRAGLAVPAGRGARRDLTREPGSSVSLEVLAATASLASSASSPWRPRQDRRADDAVGSWPST